MARNTNALRSLWAVSVLVLATTFGSAGITADCDEDDTLTGEILLELSPGTTIEFIEAQFNVTRLDSIPQWSFWKVKVAEGADVQTVIAAIENFPEEIVNRAEAHTVMETPEGVQRSLPDLGNTFTPVQFLEQETATILHVQDALNQLTGAGVTVAVLDTGMSLDHPQTASRILAPGVDFVDGEGPADAQPDGIDNDLDMDIDEMLHHGTFVAGLIHLVAPDAKILPLRILDSEGRGDAWAVARAILYAVQHNADVINLSLGLGTESRVIERALEDAEDTGTVVISAAGNRAKPCVEFPAEIGETIAVAAVDANLIRTDFTSYGPEVDLSAPALEVLSTFGDDLFIAWSGTSFAAPLVSGGAALLKEKYPGLTVPQLRTLLPTAVQPDNNPPEDNGLMGVGVLELELMTQALAGDRLSVKVAATPQGTVLSWSPVAGAGHYDVARGDVADLALGIEQVLLGPLICIADDLAATDTSSAPDAEIPAAGQVYYYVFRDNAPDGGSYGVADDDPRIPGATDCPSGG